MICFWLKIQQITALIRTVWSCSQLDRPCIGETVSFFCLSGTFLSASFRSLLLVNEGKETSIGLLWFPTFPQTFWSPAIFTLRTKFHVWGASAVMHPTSTTVHVSPCGWTKLYDNLGDTDVGLFARWLKYPNWCKFEGVLSSLSAACKCRDP